MNLQHLRYFVTVAAERNFTRAAQRLYVVQSAVSAGVRALEKELGAELFDRSGQRVALTGAGEALLPRAVATLDAAREARDAVLATQGRVYGTLNLGAMTAVGIGLVDVPGLLGRYHRLHPDVELRLHTSPGGTVGHFQSLLMGDLDAAFVSPSGRVPSGLNVRRLASSRLPLVVPPEHRLAGRKGFTFPELADEPFVDSPVGYGNRDLVDRAFAGAGVSRRVTLEVTDLNTTAAFVRHGLGSAFLPEFLLGRQQHLSVLHPRGRALIWSFSLAISSDRRPAAPLAALLSLLDDEVDRYLSRPDE